MPVTTPPDGIYAGIPDNRYHADRGSLSSSGARLILEPGGPAKLRWRPPVFKDEYDLGHVVHMLILGEGSELAVVKADSWRTKDARERKEKARADGKVPILHKTFMEAQRIAGAVHTDPLGEVLFADGRPERSVYWTDPETGVRCRCRPDWLTGPLCVDAKTTKSAAPQDFTKSVLDYGYHQQAAFYVDGLAAHGIAADFLFFAVETTKPYLCSANSLPAELLDLGRQLNRHAIRLFADCLEADRWPGYDPIIHTLTPPAWAMRRIDDTLERLEGQTA